MKLDPPCLCPLVDAGRREFVETQLLLAPNVYRSGTYHTSAGPVVTLF